MAVKSTSSSLAAMMCSLEQPLSLSFIVILNVNQSEVTFCGGSGHINHMWIIFKFYTDYVDNS